MIFVPTTFCSHCFSFSLWLKYIVWFYFLSIIGCLAIILSACILMCFFFLAGRGGDYKHTSLIYYNLPSSDIRPLHLQYKNFTKYTFVCLFLALIIYFTYTCVINLTTCCYYTVNFTLKRFKDKKKSICFYPCSYYLFSLWSFRFSSDIFFS